MSLLCHYVLATSSRYNFYNTTDLKLCNDIEVAQEVFWSIFSFIFTQYRETGVTSAEYKRKKQMPNLMSTRSSFVLLIETLTIFITV